MIYSVKKILNPLNDINEKLLLFINYHRSKIYSVIP